MPPITPLNAGRKNRIRLMPTIHRELATTELRSYPAILVHPHDAASPASNMGCDLGQANASRRPVTIATQQNARLSPGSVDKPVEELGKGLPSDGRQRAGDGLAKFSPGAASD